MTVPHELKKSLAMAKRVERHIKESSEKKMVTVLHIHLLHPLPQLLHEKIDKMLADLFNQIPPSHIYFIHNVNTNLHCRQPIFFLLQHQICLSSDQDCGLRTRGLIELLFSGDASAWTLSQLYLQPLFSNLQHHHFCFHVQFFMFVVQSNLCLFRVRQIGLLIVLQFLLVHTVLWSSHWHSLQPSNQVSQEPMHTFSEVSRAVIQWEVPCTSHDFSVHSVLSPLQRHSLQPSYQVVQSAGQILISVAKLIAADPRVANKLTFIFIVLLGI